MNAIYVMLFLWATTFVFSLFSYKPKTIRIKYLGEIEAILACTLNEKIKNTK